MIRSQFTTLSARLTEQRCFIQVVTGPRQVGKTTLVRQAVEQLPAQSCHWASADEPVINTTAWLAQQWELARLKCSDNGTALLVLDEIQKIHESS